MKKLCTFLLLPIALHLDAQGSDSSRGLPTEMREKLEDLTAANADVAPEDDSYLLQMEQFRKHPLNINTVTEQELAGLHLLSPLQVAAFFDYRKRLGDFLDPYELQSVPFWDAALVERLRPFIATAKMETLSTQKPKFSGGEHTLLLRVGQTLQTAAGYKISPASGKNYYEGSPQNILLRYRYNYKNILEYGVLGEKDAGEKFFSGNEKSGFDFYSAHFFAKNIGLVKALALGDYTVNLGQGLLQWMSLAFKQSPDITDIKREGEVLRPYRSAGEINFHRGAGITLARRNLETTLFFSRRRVDANFAAADTIVSNEDYVTSLQTSGYHRTPSEIADKGALREMVFGGNLSYRVKELHVGLNAVRYNFSYPLIKQDQPYNLNALTGKELSNYSVDYSYTYENVHAFGETAISGNRYRAAVAGLLVSVAKNAYMSFVYRDISPGYQALYADAFTQNGSPTNERGLFAGLSVRPNRFWKLDAYLDLFRFPWLKYRVDAPSSGSSSEIRAIYTPDKTLEITSRLRFENKAINYNPDNHTYNYVLPQPTFDWRSGLSYRVNRQVTVRSRVESLWYNIVDADQETGFLLSCDLLYKPAVGHWSLNARFQYFETDGYNSRLYNYEDDVLYSYSIPVFYGRGYRYYINMYHRIRKNLEIWVRVTETSYPDQSSVSSYLDQINGNRKTAVELQLLQKF